MELPKFVFLAISAAILLINITSVEAGKKEQIEKLKKQLESCQQEKTSSGYTYIRWGRTVCAGDGTQLVYKGMVGGSLYSHQGGAANHLCLPEDPEWANYNNKPDGFGGFVFGAEYQFGQGAKEVFKGQQIESTTVLDAPCAVCQSPRQAFLMIPGKRTCPNGWSVEYNGYLTAGHYGHAAASEYICLDDTPEVLAGGTSNHDGILMYTVEARCGSLRCPPYVNGREITCVVCSK